jgi:transcription initiation factor IIF auxiliary subunit
MSDFPWSVSLMRLSHRAVKYCNQLAFINKGTKDVPDAVQTADGTTAATEDQIEEIEKEIDKYEQKDCAVKQIIEVKTIAIPF